MFKAAYCRLFVDGKPGGPAGPARLHKSGRYRAIYDHYLKD